MVAPSSSIFHVSDHWWAGRRLELNPPAPHANPMLLCPPTSCSTESSCASNESRTEGEGDTGPAPKTLQRCQVFQRSEPSSSSLLLQNSLHPCQTIPNPGFHRAQWNLLTLRNLAMRHTGIKSEFACGRVRPGPIGHGQQPAAARSSQANPRSATN